MPIFFLFFDWYICNRIVSFHYMLTTILSKCNIIKTVYYIGIGIFHEVPRPCMNVLISGHALSNFWTACGTFCKSFSLFFPKTWILSLENVLFLWYLVSWESWNLICTVCIKLDTHFSSSLSLTLSLSHSEQNTWNLIISLCALWTNILNILFATDGGYLVYNTRTM